MGRMVNDCFQLRDCPAKTPVFFGDQRELIPGDPAPRCMRRDFGICLGPCARGCTSRQYAARVRAARDFLTAGNTGVLDELKQAMRAAAAREDFEHAAALRDLWQGLRELHEQLERLKTVRRDYSFVYPLPSYSGGESWHLVHRGQVMAVVDAPRNRRTAREAMAAMNRVFAAPASRGTATDPDDPDIIHLVSMWFRTHIGELDRTLSVTQARQVCLASGAAPVA
jgi:excinuclease ABC subunit C